MNPIKPALGQLRFRSLMLMETLLECGSLHAAAQQLHLTQPALSSMLREIETAFGGKLFERSPKGMQPNTVGAALIERSRLILNELRNAEREALALREGRGELRLGVTPMMMLDMVPRALHRFGKHSPDTRVFIKEGNVPMLFKELAVGNVDMVLARFSPLYSDAAKLAHRPLFDDSPCVMAKPTHELIRKKRLRWDDVVHAKWALPPRETVTWQNFAQAFTVRGLVPPEAQYESSSFHSSVRLVHQTEALMVAPASVAADYERLGLVTRLPLKFPGVLPPISLIQRSEYANRPVVDEFIQALQAQLPGWAA